MCEDSRYLERRKLDEELAKHKVKCKCGHTAIILDVDKIICSHCGHYIYKNKKLEFRERMKKCLNK